MQKARACLYFLISTDTNPDSKDKKQTNSNTLKNFINNTGDLAERGRNPYIAVDLIRNQK